MLALEHLQNLLRTAATGSKAHSMMIELRPVGPDDESFLYEVYCSTRTDELSAWGWSAAQQDAFMRLQFMAQQRHYRDQLPHAEQRIICRAGRPIGQMIVCRDDDALLLVDIALLPTARGAGIGESIIRDLQAEAVRVGLPIRLHVVLGNRAARLYQRLGFVARSENSIRQSMEWQSVS